MFPGEVNPSALAQSLVQLLALVPDVGELALDVVAEPDDVAVGIGPLDELVVAAPVEPGDKLLGLVIWVRWCSPS